MTSFTRFASLDESLAEPSYQPCHLLGASDIYGNGVRYSFYIQYAAAIIALWFNIKKDVSSARFGLSILAIALFINLCINSTGDGIVLLDWAIVLEFIWFLPIYVVWRPGFSFLVRNFPWISRIVRAGLSIVLRMKPSESNLPDQNIDNLTEEYVSKIKALLTLQKAGQRDQHYNNACRDCYTAKQSFIVNSFPDTQPPHTTPSSPTPDRANLDTFELPMLKEFFNLQLNQNPEKANRQAVWRAALESFESLEDAIDCIGNEYKRGWRQDKIHLAIPFLIWIAYNCATPWMYFVAITKGQKEGCDVKLRNFFYPVSIYSEGYRIWLRVYACFMVASAVTVTVIAIYLLFQGMRFRFRKTEERNKTDSGENGSSNKNGDLNTQLSEEIRQSADLVYNKVRELRQFILRWIAVPVCTIVLVSVAVIVELTIKTNNIDLSGSPLSSTGQLLPLLIALITALSVIFHCIEDGGTREQREKSDKIDFRHKVVEWMKLRKRDEVKQRKRGGNRKDEQEDNNQGKKESPTEDAYWKLQEQRAFDNGTKKEISVVQAKEV